MGKPPVWFEKLTQIKVNQTSVEEIEKLFLNPARINSVGNPAPFMNVYETLYGRLTVSMTNNKVTSASLSLKNGYKFSSLKTKMKDVEYFKENDNPTEHYCYKDHGFDIAVQRGKVYVVTVFDPADYEGFKRFAIYG